MEFRKATSKDELEVDGAKSNFFSKYVQDFAIDRKPRYTPMQDNNAQLLIPANKTLKQRVFMATPEDILGEDHQSHLSNNNSLSPSSE